MYNLISFLGMLGLIGFGILVSENRKKINYKIIFYGVVIQFLIALMIFQVPLGKIFFQFLNSVVIHILGAANSGSQFLFGRLALAPGMNSAAGEGSLGFYLAFQVFPIIIFFSSLMSLLYYYNIIQKLISLFSKIFNKYLNISGAESLSASANIFVGIESGLMIKSYLKKMTRSEITLVLTASMATVASNVLALYVFSMQNVFPSIAGHLISASLLSAPAAIVFAKLLCPETKTPQTMGKVVKINLEKDDSFFDAVINGSMTGLKMITGIAALLIAVLGLVALGDILLGGVSTIINNVFSTDINITIAGILSLIFYPFTLLLGVNIQDAYELSKILGERVVLTEVASYFHLSAAFDQGLITDKRTVFIGSYALCGFAHFASLAIFIGGYSVLAPNQKSVLTSVGFKALLAANLACLLSAAIAGVFYTPDIYLFTN